MGVDGHNLWGNMYVVIWAAFLKYVTFHLNYFSVQSNLTCQIQVPVRFCAISCSMGVSFAFAGIPKPHHFFIQSQKPFPKAVCWVFHEILPWWNILLWKSSFLLILFLSPVLSSSSELPTFRLRFDWCLFCHFDLSKNSVHFQRFNAVMRPPPNTQTHTITNTFQIRLPVVDSLQQFIV